MAALSLNAAAVLPEQIRWHNEATDTTRITEILTRAVAIKTNNPQDRVMTIARLFLDTPYVAHTLESDSVEQLTVNLEQLDCTTFVETVLTLAKTAAENRSSWRDFVHNLENIRYRNGHLNGYASRLHYVSDWIIDNSHRGNIYEATNRAPKVNYTVKTIDFMTEHRDSYPALADSAQFARVDDVERGYMSHRFPYIKAADLALKPVMQWLCDGDFVALTTKTKGLDVSHMGIISKGDDGIPRLMHASSSAGKVVIDTTPLAEYFKRNRNLTGLRVIRIKD